MFTCRAPASWRIEISMRPSIGGSRRITACSLFRPNCICRRSPSASLKGCCHCAGLPGSFKVSAGAALAALKPTADDDHRLAPALLPAVERAAAPCSPPMPLVPPLLLRPMRSAPSPVLLAPVGLELLAASEASAMARIFPRVVNAADVLSA